MARAQLIVPGVVRRKGQRRIVFQIVVAERACNYTTFQGILSLRKDGPRQWASSPWPAGSQVKPQPTITEALEGRPMQLPAVKDWNLSKDFCGHVIECLA